MSAQNQVKRLSLRDFALMKGREPITMLTAYDYAMAQTIDSAGIEMILVGDSLGNVIYGFENTLPVTMDMTIAHTAAVVRATERAFVIADLPFLSYQVSVEEGIRNAGRCLKEAGAQAVKLEGASEYHFTLIRRLVESGVPVMGHVGLTPQSVHQLGGYYTHGKDIENQSRIRAEAFGLQDAGCFAVVLECVDADFAARLSQELHIPTIGIGSGVGCDGQVLVTHDMVGLTVGSVPKFVKVRRQLMNEVRTAVEEYRTEVKLAVACRDGSKQNPFGPVKKGKAEEAIEGN